MPESAPSLWSAVKDLCLDKTAKRSASLNGAVQRRVRKFQSVLPDLRKATVQDSRLNGAVSVLQNQVSRVPSKIQAMDDWCRDISPFLLEYIDAYASCEHLEDSSLLKAPFVFVDELRDLLQAGESQYSMPLGVASLSSVSLAARKMLAVQASRYNANDIDFSRVHSFDTGKPVSAIFDTVDIMDRAIFDMSVRSAGKPVLDCVVELILLHRRERQSLAICEVMTSGVRSLLFPCFKGSDLHIVPSLDDDMLILGNGRNTTITLVAAACVAQRWVAQLSRTFRTEESHDNLQVDGLGITFSSPNSPSSKAIPRGDVNASPEAKLPPSLSFASLKRVSLGLPLDFSEELKNLINEETARGFGEEEKTKVTSQPDMLPQSFLPQPPASTLKSPRSCASHSLYVSAEDSDSQIHTPMSGEIFKPPSTQVTSSAHGSPTVLSKSLPEAAARRRRIERKLLAKEEQHRASRHSQDAVSAVDVTSKSVPDLSTSSSKDLDISEAFTASCESIPALFNRIGGPPNIPIPSPGVKKLDSPSNLVKVTTPKRPKVRPESHTNLLKAADLSVVPISPVIEAKEENRDIPPAHKPPTRKPSDMFLQNGIPASLQPLPKPPVPESRPVAKGSPVSRVFTLYTPSPSADELNSGGDIGTPASEHRFNDPDLTEPVFFYEDKPANHNSKLKALKSLFKRNKSSTDNVGARKQDVHVDEQPRLSRVLSGLPDSEVKDEDNAQCSQPPTQAQAQTEPVLKPAVSEQSLAVPEAAAAAADQTDTNAVRSRGYSRSRPIESIYRTSSEPVEESSGESFNTSLSTGATVSSFGTALASASSEPLATCEQSNNRTIEVASSQFSSSRSLAQSLASMSSAKSSNSRVTVESYSTANTSVGSTAAWNKFLTGIKEEASKEVSKSALTRQIQEVSDMYEKVRQERIAKEKELEMEERQLKLEAQAKPVVDTAPATYTPRLDPGREQDVVRTIPIIRKMYEAKTEESEAKPTEIQDLFSATGPSNSVAPLQPKVSFADSLQISMFSGTMWVSKWSGNRWMPLSQAELKVSVAVENTGGLIVVAIPGSSDHSVKFGRRAEVRLSSAHDVEVRSKKDVYMFRSRNTSDAQKLYSALQALHLDISNPDTYIGSKASSSTDSDTMSLSTVNSTISEGGTRRTLTPPVLSGKRVGSPAAPLVFTR